MVAFPTIPMNEEDELRKRIPVPIPSSGNAPASPVPAVIPKVGQAVIPSQTPQATPQTATPAPAIPRVPTEAQTRLQNLEAHGSGISNIHNKAGRTFARIGDIILGTFAPRAETLTPGTEGNYAMNLARARNAVQGEQATEAAGVENELKRAQAHHAEASARNLEQEKEAKPMTVKAGEGIWDPASKGWLVEPTKEDQASEVTKEVGEHLGLVPTKDGRYLLPKGGASLLKPEGEKTQVIERSVDGTPHSVLIDKNTGKDIADLGEKGKQRTGHVIDRQVNGRPHNVLVDSETGKDIADLGEKGKTESAATGTWTFGKNADNEDIIFNSKTGDVRAAPQGVHRLNAATQTRQDQAKVIKTAGDQLIAEIERNRGKVGNLGSYWKQFTNGSPIADKDVSGLMAQLASFAALQPALHGFRGQQALEGFEKIIGGVPKNPDALEAAIRAIQGTAGVVETGGREGGEQLPGGISIKDIDAEIERRKKRK